MDVELLVVLWIESEFEGELEPDNVALHSLAGFDFMQPLHFGQHVNLSHLEHMGEDRPDTDRARLEITEGRARTAVARNLFTCSYQ